MNNSRLSSMLAFQGFLFASYFLAANEKEYLPYLGIFGAAITMLVAAFGVVSVRRLLTLWDEIEKDHTIRPFGLQASSATKFLGPSFLLPLACVVALVSLIW
uniref:Uncharacterized protein n=1 Tax=Candidatus Kentrum sp. FW TaxID=2126338 RepID=A0A450THV5_9GAMM|nr:MAG: hypothetical protein BECKFW1821C_GA0114237_101076 [Candidatus Kentron sp. FW]